MAPPQGMAESVIGAGGASLGKKKKKKYLRKGRKHRMERERGKNRGAIPCD